MDRDPEMIAYLDDKFASIDRRFDGVDRRFDGVDRRFDGVDGKFASIDRRFDGVDRRFDETEEQVRHTTVVVEEIRSEVKAVAEGHEMLDAKMDRFYQELKLERRQDRDDHRTAQRELRRRDDALEARIQRLEAAASR